jgi:hypothetical protein
VVVVPLQLGTLIVEMIEWLAHPTIPISIPDAHPLEADVRTSFQTGATDSGEPAGFASVYINETVSIPI